MTYCDPFPRGTRVSQGFGAGANTGYNGRGGHTGKDYAVKKGTPVHAAADGIIEFAGEFDDTYADNLLWLINFGGKTIVLDAGPKDYSFVYAHLDKFLVKSGDRVRKGQIIALSGNSGTATTGDHCHTETIKPGYILNSPTLGRSNPALVFDEFPGEFQVLGEIIKELAVAITEPEFERIFASGDGDADKVINKLEPLLERAIELLEDISENTLETRDNVRKTVYKLKAENATAESER